MSIAWMNVAALAALGLVALPIAVHLLVRQQTRTLAFPSLRFLQETALASLRRRTVQDAVLLLCRMAIVAAAAVALAGPVFQTPSRMAAHANRVARAIVFIDADADGAPDAPAAGVFRSARFARAAVADAVGEALGWLDRQPPASRELVFTGVFRRGSIDRADLAMVPDTVGIRFVPLEGTAASADVRLPVLTRRNELSVLIERLVRLGPDDTELVEGAVSPLPADRIHILAANADQRLAEAALKAALDAGVRWTSAARRVVIAWDGADEARLQEQSVGAEVVRMRVPRPSASAASAVAAALDAATPRAIVEPRLIPRERMDAWSRRPGPPPAGAPAGDEGDRRWFWALAMALIVVEQVLRRNGGRQPAALGQEARVA